MGREDCGAGSEICKHFDVRFTKLVTFGPESALGQFLKRTVNHEKMANGLLAGGGLLRNVGWRHERAKVEALKSCPTTPARRCFRNRPPEKDRLGRCYRWHRDRR